jgi:hypothetical protein
MPIRTVTIATSIKEISQNINIPRGEALDINLTPAGLDLAFTVSDSIGGDPILEIPGAASYVQIRPDHYGALKEGTPYFCEIWNMSDANPIRLTSGRFSAANSIQPNATAFATMLFEGAGAVAILTLAEYQAGPINQSTVYVITDTGEIWARGVNVASGTGAGSPGGGVDPVDPEPVAAPEAAGALLDWDYTEGDGVQAIPTASDFTGADLVFASTVGTIDAATGVLTFDPATVGTFNAVITATNAGGSAQSGFTITVAAQVAAAPITAVGADGWRATWPDAAASFAATDITVTRQGYNAAAAPVAVSDTVRTMTRVRNPYPAQATLTDTDVALSDFIYAGDEIAGVTNNSARPAPKPQAVWLDPDHEIFAGAAQLRLFVDHAHARAGRPVAAVKFTVTGGGVSREVIVSNMTNVLYANSGLNVPVFQADLDITDLPDGPVLVDAIVYPWVGAAFQLSVQGHAAPHMTATTRDCYKNANNTIGQVFAYVAASGSDAGGVASAAAATAQASPFATSAAAATAIKNFNSANTGRADVSGGVIRFLSGTYVMGASTWPTPSLPLILEAPAGQAVILTDGGINQPRNVPARCILRNVTLRATGSTTQIIEGSNALSDSLVFENCNLDPAGQAYASYWISRAARMWMINCTDLDGMSNQFFGTQPKALSLSGFVGKTGPAIMNMIASKGSNWYAQPPVNGKLFSHAGAACAFSVLSAVGGLLYGSGDFAAAVDGLGLSITGNVFEMRSANGPAVRMWADGNEAAVHNVNYRLNTNAGDDVEGRINAFYNDHTFAPVAAMSWRFQFCVTPRYGTKTDVFASDGTMVGNWPAVFHVGHRNVAMLEGDTANNAEIGAGSWRREVELLGSQWGNGAGGALDPLWTSDQSYAGTGAGGGDYTPQAASALSNIPAGLAPFPSDQRGRLIANDGSAVIGALQKA